MAAVVSLANVIIRGCQGISDIVVVLKDAPNAAQHLRQTVQNVQSVIGTLRVYEYEPSNLFIEQQQLLPELVQKGAPGHAYRLGPLTTTLTDVSHPREDEPEVEMGL